MSSVKKFRILKFKSKKPPILSIKGISKSINKIPILKNINLNISKGELYGLLGPNGAGKSVTFNCLLGVMKVDQGDIYVEGTRINALPIHERAKRFGISYVSQMDSVFRGLSCEDNLRAVAEIIIKDKVKQETIVQELLSEFNLNHVRRLKADVLSGGQRKKCIIARALINNPKLLLLDEPLGAVDPISIDMIKKIIVDLQVKRGVSVLITDHNAQNVLSIVDYCSLIVDGEIICNGRPHEIVKDRQARKFYFGENW